MTRDTYSAQKLKIEKEIGRLQRQAKALQTKRRAPVITSIVRSMREYDITPQEIEAAFGRKSPKTAKTAPRKASPVAAKRTVPAKYRHPETGQTWTGRGKTPRWIVHAEGQGQKRNDFLVNREAQA
jgi:DNA-binding protein H-NS